MKLQLNMLVCTALIVYFVDELISNPFYDTIYGKCMVVSHRMEPYNGGYDLVTQLMYRNVTWTYTSVTGSESKVYAFMDTYPVGTAQTCHVNMCSFAFNDELPKTCRKNASSRDALVLELKMGPVWFAFYIISTPFLIIADVVMLVAWSAGETKNKRS
jgi:hypothetical protein